MSHEQIELDWKSMLEQAGPYPLEAYNFVREGLSFTVQQIHDQPELMPTSSRHISGQQLCFGLRDFAIDQYGLMAPVVLKQWYVTRTEDFGRIVFAMVDAGLMSKTADDTLDDFRGVFDFAEAFERDAILHRMTTG